MEWLYDPQAWFSLVTLSALEIVLGIDNVVFLAVLAARLPAERRPQSARMGLAIALAARLAVLAVVAWAIRHAAPLVTVFGHPFSLRDIVVLGGGVFLLAKGTHEIHGALEGDDDGAEAGSAPPAARQGMVLAQMLLLDMVFALDSVATAVGMADHVAVMGLALVAAMALMLLAAAPLSDFLAGHPTVKMLALAFLMLVGTTLAADGLGAHLPKAYLGFALAFSAAIEGLNLLVRRRQKPVRLRHPLR